MENFITAKITEDLNNGTYSNVVTRFPPEPNGYLHLGHVKSIMLNSGLAEKFGGEFNFRFDDTNPEKETEEYVKSIIYDVNWLVGNVARTVWASDYFDIMYECAEHLIKKGLAYVDDESAEDIKAKRGDFNTLGKDSLFRGRSVEENLTLFRAMRDGKFENGAKVLRAKIDMSHRYL